MVNLLPPSDAHEQDENNDRHNENWDNGMTSPTTFPFGVSNTISMPGTPPTGRPTEHPIAPHSPPEVHQPWTSSTWSTSIYTQISSTYPRTSQATTKPGPVASENVSSPTSTTVNDSGDLPPWGLERKGSSNHGAMYVAAGVVPVVMVAFVGLIVFFYLRKRKRQRKEAAAARAKMQEMQMKSRPVVAPHYESTPLSLPPATQPQYAAVPTQPPPQTVPASPPPVILGPIGSGSNGAYFTGIDTSDVMSVNERTGLGNPFADGDSLHEEPPPPYRPRSIAPSSRNSSLRLSSSAHSQTNLIARQNQDVRSPFADPDDETVSVVSVPSIRRQQDRLSVMSDLSYQENPTNSRRAI